MATSDITKYRLPFVQVDVFTSRPLEGNQLAVFLDGSALSDKQMQAIARETNFSETTFIMRRDQESEREQGYKVRIFTVAEELPFAGHPTLGTAYVLHRSSGAAEITLDLKAGRIPVSFATDEQGHVLGEMRQRDPEFGAVHFREEVARVCGLSPEDIDPNFPIQTVSTGLQFTMVPIRSLSTMQHLPFTWSRAAEYLERSGGRFFYFVCQQTVDRAAGLHARMIFYNGEDPATGSAAGGCAAWMVAHGVAKPEQRVLIEQGMEIGRPSRIYVRAGKSGTVVNNVRVGGSAVEVARGEYFL